MSALSTASRGVSARVTDTPASRIFFDSFGESRAGSTRQYS